MDGQKKRDGREFRNGKGVQDKDEAKKLLVSLTGVEF
jgi:hypothetical protein